jgi:hypothetical protein
MKCGYRSQKQFSSNSTEHDTCVLPDITVSSVAKYNYYAYSVMCPQEYSRSQFSYTVKSQCLVYLRVCSVVEG